MFPRRRQIVWFRVLLVTLATALPAGVTRAAGDAQSGLPVLDVVDTEPRDQVIGEPIDIARQALLAEIVDSASVERILARLAGLTSQLAASGSIVGNDLEKT